VPGVFCRLLHWLGAWTVCDGNALQIVLRQLRHSLHCLHCACCFLTAEQACWLCDVICDCVCPCSWMALMIPQNCCLTSVLLRTPLVLASAAAATRTISSHYSRRTDHTCLTLRLHAATRCSWSRNPSSVSPRWPRWWSGQKIQRGEEAELHPYLC